MNMYDSNQNFVKSGSISGHVLKKQELFELWFNLRASICHITAKED